MHQINLATQMEHPAPYQKSTFDWGTFLHAAEHYTNRAPALSKQNRIAQRPAFVAPSHLARPAVPFANVQFTFTDELLDDIVRHSNEYKKDFTTALTYGYMGNANGGVNGIVRLRGEDERMNRRVEEYLKSVGNTSIRDYYHIGLPQGTPGTPDYKPASVEGVKIVCHRKNGLRTIGIRDSHTNHILFFDRMAYKA
jgi:hypothetical protein